ncbi:hypothetical protein KL909_004280 [Ogataea angusta]|uniref:Uncharacterized protein n=1 Tax=Pichia angusta TaxID=870730 RepID=A0AAN6I409_PICAN|nr:uncharacterized protein KL928_005097 [Ogataea angusta]KAG7816131.1 hypothetical protein KL928_005097 [Ogataea angusta]KAG7821393.1 hypothetical protein KL909_004280 [Ogataea angusta]KAG7830032.1 hypothetical protein KL943_005198 [Ogataea angusta]
MDVENPLTITGPVTSTGIELVSTYRASLENVVSAGRSLSPSGSWVYDGPDDTGTSGDDSSGDLDDMVDWRAGGTNFLADKI